MDSFVLKIESLIFISIYFIRFDMEGVYFRIEKW